MSTLNLSEIIIQHPEANSFEELLAVIRRVAAGGAINLNFDMKPDYRDTPRNWEWRIESAFCWEEEK